MLLQFFQNFRALNFYIGGLVVQNTGLNHFMEWSKVGVFGVQGFKIGFYTILWNFNFS